MTQIESSSRLDNLSSVSDQQLSPAGSFGSPTYNPKQATTTTTSSGSGIGGGNNGNNGDCNSTGGGDQDLFITHLKQNNDYFNDLSEPKMIELVQNETNNEVDIDFKFDTAQQKQNATEIASKSSSHTHNSNGNANGNGNGNGTTTNLNDVKVQVYYCGIIMVVYIKENLSLDDLFHLFRDICKFDEQQLFTVKWVDEEGDPCTLSSQQELDEALRLYYLNKETELIVHIFANIPERPGTQCAGEDRSIYRRGARRWRKIYLVNGHKYQAKRFARTALCKVSRFVGLI